MGSPTVEAPPPRDIGKETRDTLQAQVDLAPDVYKSEAAYRPQYADLDLKVLNQTLNGTTSNPGLLSLAEQVYPRISALSAKSQSDQRLADIQDVEQYGGRATDAFRNANPGQAHLLDQLTSQANDELAAGRNLTAGETRDAQQSARAAASARGLVMSQPAASAEVLNLDAAQTARQAQRRSFAEQVVGLNQATTTDPFLAVLGRPSSTGNQAQALLGQSQFTQNASNQMFGMSQSQWAPYAQDLNNTNYNAQAAANIANANNEAAMNGAIIGAAGQAVGGIASSL